MLVHSLVHNSLDIIDMTKTLITIFLIILLVVCFDYIFGIDRLSSCLYSCSYSAHLKDQRVGDKCCVGVVPIHYLSANVSYVPDRVVDRGCDIPVESFVFHLPNIVFSMAQLTHGLGVTENIYDE